MEISLWVMSRVKVFLSDSTLEWWAWMLTGRCRSQSISFRKIGSQLFHRYQERTGSIASTFSSLATPIVAEAVRRAGDLATNCDAEEFSQLCVALLQPRAAVSVSYSGQVRAGPVGSSNALALSVRRAWPNSRRSTSAKTR